jgi:glutamyl-tRNA(Gln) amidotransferase subunit E
VDEIQFMRKTVIDGSNTAGFQRTGLIALGGVIGMSTAEKSDLGSIGITTICLEEDAARRVEKRGDEVTYRLDRLGIPLIEVATEPEIRTPSQAEDVALRIGSLLRATKKVKRGIGTIREDLNISITDGARVEIKGVQEPKMISKYIEEEVARQTRLIEAKNELMRRDVSKDDTGETKDLSMVFKGTDSKIIKSMIKKGGVVLGIRLNGFAGLLGSQLTGKNEKKGGGEKGKEPKRILGPELAAYVNDIGVKGIFHSDELPAYGITEEEVENVCEALEIGEMDAFVLVAEEKEKAKKAAEITINRAMQSLEGVPEETRDPLPDGTSKYSRPLPGKARMYPETDIKPIRVTEDLWKRIKGSLPEIPEQIQGRFVVDYELSEEQAKQLINAGYDELFEVLIAKHPSKKMRKIMAKTLLNTIPELESKGIPISKINENILDAIFVALEGEKYAKEGISEVLGYVVEKGVSVEQSLSELGLWEMSMNEMEEAIDAVVRERIDFVKEKGMDSVGPLMGEIMKELRGKVDGKMINIALQKKIKEICKEDGIS